MSLVRMHVIVVMSVMRMRVRMSLVRHVDLLRKVAQLKMDAMKASRTIARSFRSRNSPIEPFRKGHCRAKPRVAHVVSRQPLRCFQHLRPAVQIRGQKFLFKPRMDLADKGSPSTSLRAGFRLRLASPRSAQDDSFCGQLSRAHRFLASSRKRWLLFWLADRQVQRLEPSRRHKAPKRSRTRCTDPYQDDDDDDDDPQDLA